MSKRTVACSVGAVLVWSVLLSAPTMGLADDSIAEESLAQRIPVTGIGLEEARAFFATLQAAVRAGNRAAVSALVEFPIEVSVAGNRRTISSRRAFEKRYDSIICKQVADVILSQDFESLFANWRGLMIGRGEVWFGGICEDTKCAARRVRITAINGSFDGKCAS